MKRTLIVIVSLFFVAVTSMITSCGSCSSTEDGIVEKEYNIVTTEDWMKLMYDVNSLEEIDEVYTTMSPRQINNIMEDLSQMISCLKKDDPQAETMCNAFICLSNLTFGLQTLYEKKHSGFSFPESEYKRFCKLFDEAPRDKAITILGAKETNEIFDAFERWLEVQI